MIKRLFIVLLTLIPTLSVAQDCFNLELEMEFADIEKLLSIDLSRYEQNWMSEMDINDDVSRNYLIMEDYIPQSSTDFNQSAIRYYDLGIMQFAFYKKKLITIRSKHSPECSIIDQLSNVYGEASSKSVCREDEEPLSKDAESCLVWANKSEVILFYKQELIKIARRSIPAIEVIGITVMDAYGNEL